MKRMLSPSVAQDLLNGLVELLDKYKLKIKGTLQWKLYRKKNTASHV
jgi:hypothetical protein